MKKKSMKIGIDLGSTYSVFSEYNADTNSPETLKTDTAAPSSIPSVVCVNVDSNEVLAGFRAKNVMGDEEYAVFEAFKMLLIENDPDSLRQFRYNGENTPRKITTLFLKSILQDIMERYLTDDGVFEMVYICVPEIWCSETRNLDALDGKAILREILMKETGMPIKKVRVVTEPEAASAFFAWNYKKENRKAFNGHLLLIDYGGGTLDLTLTEVRSSEGGDMEIASYGIVNRLAFLFLMVVIGLNQGMQPIAGYNYGARLYGRLHEVLTRTITMATCVMTFGFLLGMFVPQLCARAFTTDPELIMRVAHDMRIQLLAFPIIGFQIVTTNFFQCIGMPGKSIFLSLSRQLIFLLPPLLILPRLIGSDGIWWSMPISDTLATFTTAYLFFRQMKKFKKMEAAQ